MASPKAKTVRFDDTPTVYPSQPEPETEVQSGLLTLYCLMKRILTRIARGGPFGRACGDSSDAGADQ
jgi:hypothetical protein